MRAVLLVTVLLALALALATPLSSNDVNAVARSENDGEDKDKDKDNGHDSHDGHDHSDHGHDGHDHGDTKDKDKDKDKKKESGSSGSSGTSGPTSGGDLSGVPVAAGAQGGSNPVCFPGSATVTIQGGENKRMSQVEIGDRVAVGGGKYSEVFMFTHRLKDEVHVFVELTTEDGAVMRATEGHFLYANGKSIVAGEVNVGDLVEREDGRRVGVTRVERVTDVGLYNPQTAQGDIVVNGIRASTYTTAVERGFAHAALAPVRAAFARLGLVCGLFESGGGKLVALIPGH